MNAILDDYQPQITQITQIIVDEKVCFLLSKRLEFILYLCKFVKSVAKHIIDWPKSKFILLIKDFALNKPISSRSEIGWTKVNFVIHTVEPRLHYNGSIGRLIETGIRG